MMLDTSERGLHRGILLWEETYTISASQEETPLGNTWVFYWSKMLSTARKVVLCKPIPLSLTLRASYTDTPDSTDSISHSVL